MNLLQFVLIKLTGCLVIGIIIGYYFDVSIGASFLITGLGLFTMYWLHFKSTMAVGAHFGYATMISCIGVGLISVSLHSSFNYQDQINNDNIDELRLWRLSITEELKPTAYYQRFLAQVDYIDTKSSAGLLLCRLPLKAGSKMRVGDKILIWAKPEEIEGPKNPHQFDYKKFMKNQGVFFQMKINPDNFIKLEGKNFSPKAMAQRWREEIILKLRQKSFGQDELAVIQAILLGYKHDVDNELSDNYKSAGAMHIMAISGLHIGVILVIISFLLKPLKRIPYGKLIQFIITVLILWSFALIAGFSASIIRAVSMFTFLAYAMYINRPGSTYNILALSIFFILLIIDPLMLLQVGFQLSYAAVISIIWLYPKLMKLWSPQLIFIRRIWQLFCVGIAAQLGVLPLSLFYFHQFPTLFFISNLTIVPFLGLIIGIGLLIILLVVIDWVPEVFIRFYNVMISTMNEVVAWVGNQEVFLLTEIYFDGIHLLLSISLIISLVILVENYGYQKLRAFLLLIIGLQLWNNHVLLQSGKKSQINLLNTMGATTLYYQNGHTLKILTDHPEKVYYGLEKFRTAERIKYTSVDTLKNSYTINDKQWLILNNASIVEEIATNADIWILSNSPKINLDRYLNMHKPERIIADGSNYHSFVLRWQKSCLKYNIPFYSTGESGYLKIGLP